MLAHEMAAASLAGLASSAVGHPLDCVKVRTQTAAGQGSLAVARSMLLSEGPAAFARGISAPLSNAVALNTVMFYAFERVGASHGPLVAGAAAGVATAFLSTPFDLWKIQRQTGPAGGTARRELARFTAAGAAATRLLYRGHPANLAREGVFTTIYLGLYARVRDALPAAGGRLNVVAAASLTGGAAWLACAPFDAVKTLQQARPLGAPPLSVAGAVAELRRGGAGLAPFWRGALPATGRAMLVTSTRLTVYEAVKEALR